MSTFMDNVVEQSEQYCIKEVKLVWATDPSQKYCRLLRSNMISKPSKFGLLFCWNIHDICQQTCTAAIFGYKVLYTQKCKSRSMAFQGYHSSINHCNCSKVTCILRRDKLQDRLTTKHFHFFRLTVRKQHFRDKTNRIFTFCNKTASILEFILMHAKIF